MIQKKLLFNNKIKNIVENIGEKKVNNIVKKYYYMNNHQWFCNA